MGWPVSAKWFPAIQAEASVVVTRVDVLEPSGVISKTLYPESGSVDIDSSRAVRRQLQMSFGCELNDLSVSSAGDLLDPRSRRELQVWRGLQYADGATELVPLGTFGLAKPGLSKVAETGGIAVAITGNDRSRRLARALWTNRFPITDYPTVPVAVARIAANRLPWLRVSCYPSTVVVPPIWLGIDPGSSTPWDDIQTIVQAAGQEALIDPMGTLITRPISDPSTTGATTSFIAGPKNTLHTVSRSLDDDQTFNGVILVGEGSSIPIPLRSEAWDTNPSSLTYRPTYGDAPYFATTNIAPSQAALDFACRGMLLKMTGLTEQVDGEVTPDPSLDAGDVVQIEEPETGITGLFVIDALTVPLGVEDPMQIQLRDRRSA